MIAVRWLEFDGMIRDGHILWLQLGWGSFPLGDYLIILN